jgi:MoaA/NifB/PqqE/SkfB family radical SAM enzyme
MGKLLHDLNVGQKGFCNFVTGKPLCVSFEVTYQCNARCGHCHLGGTFDEERATPERFGELCRDLSPVVAQISGGEPLLRKDLIDIIRAIKRSRGSAMTVLTTNAGLLTVDKYHELKEAGINEFSISLDYPDERHDKYRTIPGLFKRIDGILSGLKDVKEKGIVLACVVQRRNFRDIMKLAEFARGHGVKLSLSTYTWLRTEDKSLMVPPEELDELRAILDQVLEFKKQHGTVFTAASVFDRMIRFFRDGGIPDCKAGHTFMVVNPAGTLSPCGLILGDYKDQADLIERFSKTNTCEACNTSIRANTEKPWNVMLKDMLQV